MYMGILLSDFCPDAPGEFLLLSITTSGGMFFIVFSTLKALLPILDSYSSTYPVFHKDIY
jgi:hypothetical protein